jgi:demethylmenaquinone methyltransferase/2-methoxy-6-polyprenyl-1,4-benzoquinol methylase
MSDSPNLPFGGSPLGPPNDEGATARTVQKMFAAVAPRYDFLNHFLSLGRDIAWRKHTARALRGILERPGSVVVDLCCGTGDLVLALSEFSAGSVIGADFCHPMLEIAQRKARRSLKSLQFVEADALNLPFRDACLDAVTIAFGLRNLANYGRGIQEMHRVLKPHGILAILEFSRVVWPLFGALFRFYFRRILPRVGTWISGVTGPYQYLPDSVSRFPDQETLGTALRQSKFQNIRYVNFTGGVAALHLAEKRW